MYDEENDILEAASNAAASGKFASEPLWIEDWKRWISVVAINAQLRSKLLETSVKVERRGGKNINKPDLEVMYPTLAIMCTRFPIADSLPDKEHPHYAEYPGAKNADGEYLTPPHSKAGQSPFKMEHLYVLNRNSGAILEQISAVAQRLNLLRPEDFDQKKESSEDRKQERNRSISELQELLEE
jgi:hypothetical protein